MSTNLSNKEKVLKELIINAVNNLKEDDRLQNLSRRTSEEQIEKPNCSRV